MKSATRRFAALATLFGTVAAACGQQLIRRGTEAEVEARQRQSQRQQAATMREHGLKNDNSAVQAEFGMSDADFARAASASDLPVITAYDSHVDPDRVESQRIPEENMCLVRLPASGNGVDAMVNARLDPNKALPVDASPEKDDAARKIAYLRALRNCAPVFDSLRAERDALHEFFREGGKPASIWTEISWQILNSQFAITFASPDGEDTATHPNYFGDGLALRAASLGQDMGLAQARQKHLEARAALRDYVRRHPLQYEIDAAVNLRLARTLIDDMLRDGHAGLTPAVRETLTIAQEAYNQLAGGTHRPVVRTVSMARPAYDQAAHDAAVKEAIASLHLLLGRGVRDEFHLLAENGLTESDALAMIGPNANLTLIPAGDIEPGTMGLRYVGGAHVIGVAGDGIGLRRGTKMLAASVVEADETASRDFGRIALLEKMRLIGQGSSVSPQEEPLEAEVTALTYYLAHGGEPRIATGELGVRAYENMLGRMSARAFGQEVPDSVTLRVQAALAHRASPSAAQEQDAASEATDAAGAYDKAHRHGPNTLAGDIATLDQMLADKAVSLSPGARTYLESCIGGMRFIAGQPPVMMAKLAP